jgi:iron complex outermembrane receptor protein
MPANDLNNDFSASATLVGLRSSRSWPLGPGTLSVLARLDNVTDRAYAGAVVVNEDNGRYFETAAACDALLALRWSAPF